MASRKFDKRMRYVRKRRIRKSIYGTAERPRLSVFRSAKHIYAQVIDDTNFHTLVSASSLSKDINTTEYNSKIEICRKVGAAIANKAKNLGIQTIVFDRSGYLYHGRVKALAEAARENGLAF